MSSPDVTDGDQSDDESGDVTVGTHLGLTIPPGGTILTSEEMGKVYSQGQLRKMILWFRISVVKIISCNFILVSVYWFVQLFLSKAVLSIRCSCSILFSAAVSRKNDVTFFINTGLSSYSN